MDNISRISFKVNDLDILFTNSFWGFERVFVNGTLVSEKRVMFGKYSHVFQYNGKQYCLNCKGKMFPVRLIISFYENEDLLFEDMFSKSGVPITEEELKIQKRRNWLYFLFMFLTMLVITFLSALLEKKTENDILIPLIKSVSMMLVIVIPLLLLKGFKFKVIDETVRCENKTLGNRIEHPDLPFTLHWHRLFFIIPGIFFTLAFAFLLFLVYSYGKEINFGERPGGIILFGLLLGIIDLVVGILNVIRMGSVTYKGIECWGKVWLKKIPWGQIGSVELRQADSDYARSGHFVAILDAAGKVLGKIPLNFTPKKERQKILEILDLIPDDSLNIKKGKYYGRS